MVNQDTNFIGTPNNALLKLPPEDDDELYLSEIDLEEPMDYLMQLISDDEQDDPAYFPDNDDLIDEDGFISETSASDYDFEDSSFYDTDESTDSNFSQASTQTDTNVGNGS